MSGRPSHSAPAAPQQEEAQYKVGQGYIGVLQEAKDIVADAKGRKAAARANLDSITGHDSTASSAPRAASGVRPSSHAPQRGIEEPKRSIFNTAIGSLLAPAMPAWLQGSIAKRILMWGTRIVLLALLAWQWSIFSHRMSEDSLLPDITEDVLTSIDANAPDYENVRNYARYIAGLADKSGMAALDAKWSEGIPPYFKDEAKPRLELLTKGFKLGRTSVDKVTIYNVECIPDSAPARRISVEVVRSRQPDGKLVFKLQRVY